MALCVVMCVVAMIAAYRVGHARGSERAFALAKASVMKFVDATLIRLDCDSAGPVCDQLKILQSRAATVDKRAGMFLLTDIDDSTEALRNR